MLADERTSEVDHDVIVGVKVATGWPFIGDNLSVPCSSTAVFFCGDDELSVRWAMLFIVTTKALVCSASV